MLIARSLHPQPGEAERKERLLALIDGFSSRRVLIVGDIIAADALEVLYRPYAALIPIEARTSATSTGVPVRKATMRRTAETPAPNR